jgi:hypothetical protein
MGEANILSRGYLITQYSSTVGVGTGKMGNLQLSTYGKTVDSKTVNGRQETVDSRASRLPPSRLTRSWCAAAILPINRTCLDGDDLGSTPSIIILPVLSDRLCSSGLYSSLFAPSSILSHPFCCCKVDLPRNRGEWVNRQMPGGGAETMGDDQVVHIFIFTYLPTSAHRGDTYYVHTCPRPEIICRTDVCLYLFVYIYSSIQPG